MKQSKELKQQLRHLCLCKDRIKKVSDRLDDLELLGIKVCNEIKHLKHKRVSLRKYKENLQKGIEYAEGKK